MNRSRPLFVAICVLLLLPVFSSAVSAAPVSAVTAIEIGWDAWFRPGEWAPITVTLRDDASVRSCSVLVNSSQRVHLTPLTGDTHAGWVILGRTAGNLVELYEDDTLLFSTLRAEDQSRLALRAVNPEYRLAGVLFPGVETMPLESSILQRFHENQIQVVRVPPQRFRGAAELWSAIDHLMATRTALESFEGRQRETLARWQSGFGRLSLVEPAGMGRKDFVTQVIEIELHRQVPHVNLSNSQAVYDVFDWPEFPAELSRRLVHRVILLLFIWFVLCCCLPRRWKSAVRIAALLAMTALAGYAAWRVAGSARPLWLSEHAGFCNVQPGALVLDRVSSVTSLRKGEAVDVNSAGALHPLAYGANDRKPVTMKTAADGLHELRETVSPGRRHAYLERYMVPLAGRVPASLEAGRYSVENQLGVDLRDACIVTDGRQYAIGDLLDGSVASGSLKVASGVAPPGANPARDEACRQRLFALWKSTRVDPKRRYWVAYGPAPMANVALKSPHGVEYDCLWYGEIEE